MLPSSIYDGWSSSRLHVEWAVLVGQEYRLCEQDFRSHALNFALQIMSRAKRLVLDIVEDLDKHGYEFQAGSKVIVDPEVGISEWFREAEKKGIHVPVSLEAWLRVIGCVNLIGTHPLWDKVAYAEDNSSTSADILLTDPLVVEMSIEYAEYLHSEWLSLTEELEQDPTPPFHLEVAPDYLHKANISGGLPYEIDASRPAIDPILLNERGSNTFVGYIRRALRWKGFPGFEYIHASGRQGIDRNADIII